MGLGDRARGDCRLDGTEIFDSLVRFIFANFCKTEPKNRLCSALGGTPGLKLRRGGAVLRADWPPAQLWANQSRSRGAACWLAEGPRWGGAVSPATMRSLGGGGVWSAHMLCMWGAWVLSPALHSPPALSQKKPQDTAGRGPQTNQNKNFGPSLLSWLPRACFIHQAPRPERASNLPQATQLVDPQSSHSPGGS